MKKTAYLLLPALLSAACNYLDIEPVGKVIPHKTSEFRALMTEGYFRFPYIDSRAYTGLLSDEIGLLDESAIYSSEDAVALGYNYTWDYGRLMKEYPYQQYYRAIFLANAIIADAPGADRDSEERNEQIVAEAHALRAYAFFDLVNLYGTPYDPATAESDRTVPLATQIDIEQTFRPATVAAVYRQIFADIAASEALMEVEKQADAAYNYRFSKNALTAFKARALLYTGAWREALAAAASLLPKYPLVDLNGLEDKSLLPWKGTSPEAILAWERPFSGSGNDLMHAGILSESILAKLDARTDNRRDYIREAVSSESGEKIGFKIDRSGSDRTSIRIAEMYLIAAEASAHLDDGLAAAKDYLIALQEKRFRTEALEAQRAAVRAMNAGELLAEIADERARELLLEGHRWFDLRRTTRPLIVKTHKNRTARLNAGDSRYTLPFPQSAVDNNPELGK